MHAERTSRADQVPAATEAKQRAHAQGSAAKEVADWIAETDVIARSVQELLSTHEEPYVRMHLAQHTSLVEELQLTLAGDSGRHVRWALAENPAITSAAAHALYGHAAARMEDRAQDDLTRGLLSNPSLPVHLLQEAWQGPGARWSKRALAGNPSLPLSDLGPLDALSDEEQQAVSSRAGIDVATLDQLRAANPYPGVLLRAHAAERYLEVLLYERNRWHGDLGSLRAHLEALLAPLGDAAQETFVKLHPGWNGTLEELRDTARLL